MVKEVIIIECKRPNLTVQGGVSPVLGEIITTQIVDIGVKSAQFNSQTAQVRVLVNGTGYWMKQGDDTVSSVKEVAGNFPLGGDGDFVDLTVTPLNDFIDTSAL